MSKELDLLYKYDLECKCGNSYTLNHVIKPLSFLATCPKCGEEEAVTVSKLIGIK